jgi:hypothetical protein
MSDKTVVMGSFEEIEATADALDAVRALGVPDEDIEILSSLPYSSNILGRPHLKSRLPLISLASAALGLVIGLFFTVITPQLYVIRVGGQPIVPTPPTVLLLYEFTMLFLILGTFGGMLWLEHLPSFRPQYYDPSLTDGRIALLVQCPDEKKAAAAAVLRSQGAVDIHEPERRELQCAAS